MNSEILLPQNTPQHAFLGFSDNEENFEIINDLHLIINYYLFKSRDTRKISVDGLKKNIMKIYNIEETNTFQRLKKRYGKVNISI